MVNAILGLIGTLLYPLFSIIFVVLNLLQNVFYSFAGIGTVYYGSTYSGTGGSNGTGMVPITGESDGGETSTGLIYYLLTSNIVKNIVISIAILGLFLLVIFTTLAFIKTIYSDKPKSWKDILTNAIKGLTNFIVLPVCCLLGVWVGNIILQAINGATSTGGALYLDRKLFLSCAYNANTYRINTFGENSQGSADAYTDIMATINAYNNAELNKIKVEENKNSDYYAEIVDQMYALDVIPIHNHITVGVGATSHHGYYQLWSINYLFLIVGGIFMMYVMVNITYGMIKRMFILLMLFVISPALCAMYPLDEGAAVKSWSGDVKKNILSAYGAVAGMNLFFSFMPIIQNINIAGSAFGAYMADWAFVSDILQLIILICGLFCVNDFISMISGYIGAGNAFSDGKSLRSNVKGAIQKQAKKVGSVAGAFAKAGGAATVGGAPAWFGSMASSATGGVAKSLGMDWGLKDTYKKSIEDKYKADDAKVKEQGAKNKFEKGENTIFSQAEGEAKTAAGSAWTTMTAKQQKKATDQKVKELKKNAAAVDYDEDNEQNAINALNFFKHDPEMQKRVAHDMAARSEGKITQEKLLSKAAEADAAEKRKSKASAADSLISDAKERSAAEQKFSIAKLQVERLEALESQLSADGLYLESVLGHSMFEQTVTPAEMGTLSTADQIVAQRYNDNFNAMQAMPAKEILEENVKNAGKIFADAVTNLQVQMDKLATKMGVTLEEAIDTVGEDLSKLDEALTSTKFATLTDEMKKFVQELDKSRKKMKESEK